MEVARRWYKSGICLLWSVKQGRLRELMVKCVLWWCVPLLCLGVCLCIVICLWCRVGGCLSYVCVMGVFVCVCVCFGTVMITGAGQWRDGERAERVKGGEAGNVCCVE